MVKRSPATLVRLRTTPGRALCALVTSVFTLTYAPGALAAPARPARLAVVPFASLHDRVDAETCARLSRKLAVGLESSKHFELLSLEPADPPAQPAPPAKDPAAIEAAKERVAKAEEHVKKLRFKEAAAELEKAIDQLEGQHPYIAFPDLVSAHVMQAVARFRLGQDSEGERLLAQALRFNPGLKLDGAAYPPVFLRVFERIARQVKNEPKATLFVDGSAAGAEIFIDGSSRGRAPLGFTDLPRGPHFLRIVPVSGEPWARKVELNPAAPLHVSPGPPIVRPKASELVALLQKNTVDKAVLDKVAAAASGADLVVLAGVHRTGKQGLAVSSFVVSLPARTVCPLARASSDEGSGDGVVRAVQEELLKKAASCPEAAALPVAFVGDLGAAQAASSKGGKGDARKPASGGDALLVPLVPQASAAEAPLVVEAPRPPPPATAAATEAPAAAPAGGSERIGSPVWLWVLVGAAIVGAGAAGGYLLYDSVTAPVTATGTVRW